MKPSHRNTLKQFAVLLMLCCLCRIWASASTDLDRELQEFSSLAGREQVTIVVDFPLHRRKVLFWRHRGDAWLTAADARHSFEEDILVHSPDASVNVALASQVKSNNVERAQYSLFLLCLRARFVPQSEFPIKQVNGFSRSPEARRGRISQFRPDFEKLGEDANQAIREAIKSSDPKLQATAKLYSFALLDDLSSDSTTDLARRWRDEILKSRSCFADNNERAQLIFLLERSLATRGLNAIVAISSLLKQESDAAARYDEIYMLQFLDAASVRLRGSEEGREAISTAKKAWGQELRPCGGVYKKSLRKGSWRGLEDQFLRDKLPCSAGEWATLIAVALDEKYGDHLSVPFEMGYRKCGPQMEQFLSRLTDLDPTFPSWEFPSTASQDDMLHPRFWSKIQRYHEAFVKLNQLSASVSQ